MRHLIDFGDLSRAEWDSLYHRCSEIMDHPADFLDACKGRVMASLFYEPSTRTNFSFQTAMRGWAVRYLALPIPALLRWRRERR